MVSTYVVVSLCKHKWRVLALVEPLEQSQLQECCVMRFFQAFKMHVSQGIGERSSNAGFWQKEGFNLDIVAEIYFSK